MSYNPNQYQQPQYQQQQPQYQQAPYQPQKVLNQDRALWKVIVFGMLTCGIYGIVIWSGIGEDLNIAASRRDGKKTMHYCLAYFVLTPVTCGIYGIIWMHQISQRIGDEARARGMMTDFGASTFWLWNVLGSMIIVGPFIYMHKLLQAMNYIAGSYNANGF